jgi:hypothetical protein
VWLAFVPTQPVADSIKCTVCIVESKGRVTCLFVTAAIDVEHLSESGSRRRAVDVPFLEWLAILSNPRYLTME